MPDLISPRILDRTAHAPARVRLRTRAPGEVRVLALHQMACGAGWAEDSPAWDRVAAHFVVKRSGVVQMNHDPLARITVGSGPRWNPRCVTVELAGNLPVAVVDGGWRWWEGERFGRDLLTAEQVDAARALIRWLRERLPALQHVGAHRQVSRAKAGCCGPHAWAEIGAWAIARGMLLADTDGGLDIPLDWWPLPATGAGDRRAYGGPLEASPFDPYPPG